MGGGGGGDRETERERERRLETLQEISQVKRQRMRNMQNTVLASPVTETKRPASDRELDWSGDGLTKVKKKRFDLQECGEVILWVSISPTDSLAPEVKISRQKLCRLSHLVPLSKSLDKPFWLLLPLNVTPYPGR